MDAYEKLKRIKRPVLIEVKSRIGLNYEDRFRILFPDRSCIYDYNKLFHRYKTVNYDFTPSCFCRESEKLKKVTMFVRLNTTIVEMKKFDKKGDLKIVNIYPL